MEVNNQQFVVPTIHTSGANFFVKPKQNLKLNTNKKLEFDTGDQVLFTSKNVTLEARFRLLLMLLMLLLSIDFSLTLLEVTLEFLVAKQLYEPLMSVCLYVCLYVFMSL